MRLSQENEHSRWQTGTQKAPANRPQAPNNSLNFSFPKQARLLSRRHFLRVMRSGTRIAGNLIVIDYRFGKDFVPKLGITVSKRYGKAYRRNRFKRLVREAFRLSYNQFPANLEINVLPRNKCEHDSLTEIQDELISMIKRLMEE